MCSRYSRVALYVVEAGLRWSTPYSGRRLVHPEQPTFGRLCRCVVGYGVKVRGSV